MEGISSPRMAIAEQVAICLDAFHNLSISATKVGDTTQEAGTFIRIPDEFGRFKVWSSNIGAHRSGRSSLDYRLRDASHLRKRVLELLDDLKSSLNDGKHRYLCRAILS
jgi:hypothetical protein